MTQRFLLALMLFLFQGISGYQAQAGPPLSGEYPGHQAAMGDPRTQEDLDEKTAGLVYKYLFGFHPDPLEPETLAADLAFLENEADAWDLVIDKTTLFLCRAEILYRLGRTQQALIDFYRFRYHLAAPDHPCLSKAEIRLREILLDMDTDEFRLDQDQIATDIFTLVFQERNNQAPFDETQMKSLAGALDILEKNSTSAEDQKTIMFLRAESLYRMNEYKRAYVTFYRLLLQLDSSSHPLFSEVKKRLATIKRKLTPVTKEPLNRTNALHGLFASLFLCVLFVVLLARDYIKSGWQYYGCDIVEEDNLITLEEMREQDGRCSAGTLKAYQDLKKKRSFWNQFSPAQQEKFKFARLLDEGYRMICRVNCQPPLAIAWPARIRGLKWIPTYFQYSIVSAVFILLWWAATSLGWCEDKHAFQFALLFVFTVACLSSIKIMARKTVNALDELVSMLEPVHAKESLKRIQSWVTDLFRSHRQYYFGIIVMVLILIALHIKNRLTLPSGNMNLDIVFSMVLVLISAQMIWFLTGSLFLMHKLYNLKDLSMNPLSPSKTLGLEKMISVIGTYNILASLVSSLGCTIALFAAWEKGDNPAFGALWFFFITPMLIFYWVYPYVKLGSLVKKKKLNRMNFVKTKIAQLFNDWKASEDRLLEIMENKRLGDGQPGKNKEEDPVDTEKKAIENKLKDMDRYHEIFKKIEQSPETYFDFNAVLELAKALGFPSLFAILAALFSMFSGG